MRRYLRVIAPVLVAVTAAACGSPHHARLAPARANAAGHACNTNNYFMQCALPPSKPKATPPGVKALAYGVDFAWSCPSSTGYAFGASYESYDRTKNWTRACLSRWPHRVLVWETTQTRALSGFAGGVSDARAAATQTRALGAPANVHIDAAVDFDATAAQQGPIDAYFRGWDSVLGVKRVGDYGGYWPTIRLCEAHLVTRSWQTYAWSGGNWAPASCAPLEQYLNDNTVDYDRAIAADYGQYPSPPLPPPPPTWTQQWVGGFQRGYVVRWDQRRRLRVPPLGRTVVITPVWNGGYNVGWTTAH